VGRCGIRTVARSGYDERYAPRVNLARAVALIAVIGVLTGCGPQPSADPTQAGIPEEILEQACTDAVSGIVDAVAELAAGYEPDAAGEPPTTPDDGGPEAEDKDPLTAAVTDARRARDRLDCDREAFAAELADGLGAIAPSTPVAEAVWRRASASILGTVEQEAGERALTPTDDLRDALARSAEGTTIVLPPGTIDLDSTLVLLTAVTLRGSDRDETVLRTRATDAGVIVATGGLVRLENLTLELVGDDPASGLVAGPSASVALSNVRIAGARADEGGAGGAGVYMSAQGDEGSGRGTTLEVTDSVFARNGWAGVAVAGGHRVSIEGSTFADNGEVGLLFLDEAGGSVGSSSFRDNRVGLAATGSADPSWADNAISGGDVGVQVDADAAPAIDGLRVSGTSSAAVIFGGSSGGFLGDATCAASPYGIVISDAAAPTLGANECQLARGGS
jgi:hypothetical protein